MVNCGSLRLPWQGEMYRCSFLICHGSFVLLPVITLAGCNFLPHFHPTNLFYVLSSSIQTLVKISKTAGARLKPHASRLIPALLEALSTLEPQVLNYLSLRATEQEKVILAVCCILYIVWEPKR